MIPRCNRIIEQLPSELDLLDIWHLPGINQILWFSQDWAIGSFLVLYWATFIMFT